VDQTKLVELVTAHDSETTGPSLSYPQREMQILLEEAIKLASRFHFSLVEIEHILFIIAKNSDLSGHTLLTESGADPKLIQNRLTEWLFSIAMFNQSSQ